MSLDKVLVFSRRLKGVTLESSGAAPIGGDALNAALEKSFQQGYQAASDKFNAQILSLRQEMQGHAHGVFVRLEEAHAQLTHSLSAALPELIMAGVCKILGEGAMPTDLLRTRVESVVAESCPAGEPVTVRLNPEDFASLQQLDGEYLAKHPRLTFKADETLSRGDCAMETKFGQVDARLKTQLRRLMEELSST